MTSSKTYGLPQFLAALVANSPIPEGDRLPMHTGEFTLQDVPAGRGLEDIARLIGDFQGLDHEVRHSHHEAESAYLDIRFHSGRSRKVISSAYLARKGRNVTISVTRPEQGKYSK